MSRGQYKGLEEIAEYGPGDRVTILVETTIEDVRDLLVSDPRTGDQKSAAVVFGGGYVLEFPSERDARKHDVSITVRRKHL